MSLLWMLLLNSDLNLSGGNITRELKPELLVDVPDSDLGDSSCLKTGASPDGLVPKSVPALGRGLISMWTTVRSEESDIASSTPGALAGLAVTLKLDKACSGGAFEDWLTWSIIER